MGSGSMTPPVEPSSPSDGGIRKRVCKACDRCRLKKSKCDGSSPCSRCRADNAICVFGERKKSHDKVYPKGYVEMLEHQQLQLVAGLQELYRRLKAGEGWTGSPLKETTRGTPLTHDILESLGALKQDNHASSDHFEDNLESLQSRLLATGASFMQRELSFDANSEADQSPIFESVSHHQIPTFTNPFAMNRFPPTPPMGSPHPSIIKTTSRLRTQLQTTTAPSTDMSWRAEPYEFINDIDFNMSYESPVTSVNLQAMNMTAQMYHDSTGMGINPCLTMKDWQPQDDQIQHYFQNGVFT
ncbi:Fluconazole resistance protein 1 [Neophaeococcomyces mojaviensis]|uniref:Fluconazole resistance protein 1 n=1 Tax=Neophaeococcomyces mojaviensis TaxID=3383035 RepID=A0ACC3A5W0_9EURO|nr:Fluconazole resistance protein 1 [Knufia sp. JES_112]